MSPAIIPLLSFGKELLDKFIPDPQEKAKAELELLRMTQDGDLKKVLGQLEINAKEAQHASVFVSGWRPYVGWICGTGLAYAAIFHNLLEWLASIQGWPLPPALNNEILLYVLGGLLGIGGLRTYEKTKGIAAK